MAEPDFAMTRFSLIRHGSHDVIEHVLVGRMPGVRLNSDGRDQATRVANHLSRERVDAVESSPQLRAQEMAKPIAERFALQISISAELDEFDAGAWTGRSFAALHDDPLWSLWNTTRGAVRAPGGESMLELQTRAVDHLNRIASAMPNGHVALCSHAEVIRAVALHALNLPLDDFYRVDIAPATISTFAIHRDGIEVITLNQPVAS
jgi:broad specificity phosphatase PhoE